MALFDVANFKFILVGVFGGGRGRAVSVSYTPVTYKPWPKKPGRSYAIWGQNYDYNYYYYKPHYSVPYWKRRIQLTTYHR